MSQGMDYQLPEDKAKRLAQILESGPSLAGEIGLVRLVTEELLRSGQGMAAVQCANTAARIIERDTALQRARHDLISREEFSILCRWLGDLYFRIASELLPPQITYQLMDLLQERFEAGIKEFRLSGKLPALPGPQEQDAPESDTPKPAAALGKAVDREVRDDG